MNNKNILPNQGQPVVRITAGKLPHGLAELTEEALGNDGVGASACGCFCAHDGAEASACGCFCAFDGAEASACGCFCAFDGE